VLEAETVINIHVIAVHGSYFRKDAVPIVLSLPFKCDFDLPRHWAMFLGHSPLSLWLFVCESSLSLGFTIIKVLSPFHQNRDMGSQYHHVADCGWRIGGWPRVEHMGYVAYGQLFVPLILYTLCAVAKM
jgi:hypothetical protein